MKQLLLLFLVSVGVLVAQAQPGYQPSKQNLEARALFQDMKFGMFIHWGASSVLGSGEWVMNIRNIHVDEYTHLLQVFNPVDFDAKKWVTTA
ncbi:MAG: alpha-L-fucosidase, partial [Bacteroidetes bacterium 24-39-8]